MIRWRDSRHWTDDERNRLLIDSAASSSKHQT
jgi:hypothetical protein